jgi:hypothetical protein
MLRTRLGILDVVEVVAMEQKMRGGGNTSQRQVR